MEYIPLFFGAKFAYDLLMIELILAREIEHLFLITSPKRVKLFRVVNLRFQLDC